jgi:hypothetical protein
MSFNKTWEIEGTTVTLNAGVETNLIGANGQDISQDEFTAVQLKITGTNPVATVQPYGSLAKNGSVWTAVGSALGPYNQNDTALIDVSANAWDRIKFTGTSVSGSEILVYGQGISRE